MTRIHLGSDAVQFRMRGRVQLWSSDTHVFAVNFSPKKQKKANSNESENSFLPFGVRAGNASH